MEKRTSWLLRVCTALVCFFLVSSTTYAQDIIDTGPRAPLIEKELREEAADELFVLNHVPLLQATDRVMNRIDELSPIKFGAQANFLSDWLDEGMNGAKHGLQITQTYFAEYTREFKGISGGVGFEYFQVDTTGGVEGPSILERDFTIYVPLAWKRLSVNPSWTYVAIDDFYGDDSGEIGTEVSLDMPLNPTFIWNYDYDDASGNYFECDISHNIPICFNGEKFAVFTPSMAMGMNSHKGIDKTTLTHIDWGLDLGIPLNHHFTVAGLFHLTKSLSHLKIDGERVFENIIPWAGLSLTAEF
ncbi:MAG: hypothetical protein P8123_00920 [bacterium]